MFQKLPASRVAIVQTMFIACLALSESTRGSEPPRLTVIGPERITNECHTSFVDPEIIMTDGPVALAAGVTHSLALRADGSVLAWGLDNFGEVRAPRSLRSVAIAANEDYSMALTADGSVIIWGKGPYGRTNVPPAARSNVIAIAAADYHALALRGDGEIITLGLTNFAEFTVPASATNVIAIAAGGQHSLALRRDGTVVAWGLNNHNQNVIPASATNVVAIADSGVHCLALRSDGTLVTWGYPDLPQLRVPGDATNVVAIAARDTFSLALRGDGSVVVWGYSGALDVPSSATNVIGIAAGGSSGAPGYDFCLALRADGSVVGWGFNAWEQATAPDRVADIQLPYSVTDSLDTNSPGTYTLTYTATNIIGEVGTATRTVMVIDTTPPTIVCPSNLTIESTSAAGAAIIFNAQASDLCSADVAVNCEPRAGSVFPVGATPVTCIARDASGNTSQCTFQITVLGALSIKTAVLTQMEALEAVVQGAAFSNAIIRLQRSMTTNRWLDETHLETSRGSGVFLNEAAAVRRLKLMLRGRAGGYGIPVGGLPLQQWIDRLVSVDRTLAASVIAEAIEAGVGPEIIRHASNRLSAGDLAGERQRSVRAILLYRDAWRIATRAMSRLQSP